MATVFVRLGWWEFEGSTVIGIFSTKEKAEAYTDEDNRFDWTTVEGYVIDYTEGP